MTKPNPAQLHILDLPDELLLQIASDLSIKTFNSLIRTCRRAYRSLTHQLYARAVLNARAVRAGPRRRSRVRIARFPAQIGRIGSLNGVHHCMKHWPQDDQEGQAFRGECLCEAAAHGHRDMVQYLLDAGVDPDKPYGYLIPERPIVAAAENNHVGIVEILLAAGVQLDTPDDLRNCPLYAAMVRSHQPSMDLVEMLLDRANYPTAHLTTLLYAISWSGRTDMAKRMLDAGAEIDARDEGGRTPLCLAIMSGHYDLIRMLLRRGASLSNADEMGATPLFIAVEYQETSTAAIIKLLVEHGADPNERNPDGQTPLHVATNLHGGKGEIVLALLEVGADWRVTTGESDLTPLLNAMQACKEPCASIQHLIDYGAATYQPHYTPALLYWAANWGYDDIVQRCVEHGADVDVDCVMERHRPSRALFLAVASGRESLLKLLLPRVADVDREIRTYGSAVTEAARIGSEESLRLVLERATRRGVEATDLKRRTALMFAAESMSARMVSLVLEKCADIHARDTEGRTALHYAVDGGNADGVALLLQKGLDTMTEDSAGRTPHVMGMHSANLAIVDLFYDRVPDIEVLSHGETPLITACWKNRVEVAEGLLKRSADIEAGKADFKRTPLNIACEMGFDRLANLLLTHGADPYVRYYGRPNIGIAAYHGFAEVVKMLIEHGVPVDLANKLQQTPLIMAAMNGHTEVVRVLHGADIDHVDIKGRSALSYAAEVEDTSTIRCLLERGADPNMSDVQGRTPLTWAVLSGNVEGIIVLVDAGADTTEADKGGRTPVSHAMLLGDDMVIKSLYRRYYVGDINVS